MSKGGLNLFSAPDPSVPNLSTSQASALYLQACSLHQQGDITGAQRLYREAVQADPSLHIIIIGSIQGKGYGSGPPKGFNSWLHYYLQKHPIPQSLLPRVSILGSLSYIDYVYICSNSLCHTYISVPFVLSWSVLELMYLQVPLVGNDIPMISEVLEHNHTGYLFDYFSTESLVSTILKVLYQPIERTQSLSKNSHDLVVSRFDNRTAYDSLLTCFQSLLS